MRIRQRPRQQLRHAVALVLGTALGAALGMLTPTAAACGLEDPSSLSLRRGALNLAYPEALYVGTATWQAQLAGRLASDPLAQHADLSPDARVQLRRVRADLLLRRFASLLAAADSAANSAANSAADTAAYRPALAVVLVGPVLWSRVGRGATAFDAQVHVAGPEPGDVVLVTDIAVVEALASRQIGFDDALRSGLARLYGPPEDIEAARAWLLAAVHG